MDRPITIECLNDLTAIEELPSLWRLRFEQEPAQTSFKAMLSCVQIRMKSGHQFNGIEILICTDVIDIRKIPRLLEHENIDILDQLDKKGIMVSEASSGIEATWTRGTMLCW
jgi:hypothetical protein